MSDIDWNDLDGPEPDDPWEDPEPTPRPPVPVGTPAGDARAQGERARVLRHPHIAARLTQPPLRYSRPENWNGYIPPDTWRERHNDSPQRAALVDIVTAAVETDKARDTTPTEDTT